jgi:hypothetical protein
MADRAQYLARTLIARLANLQAIFAEDGRGEPDRRQRIEAIEKVLAVELGVTDGATLSVVEAAVPHLQAGQRAHEREIAGLAEFLRGRLGALLAEA